MNPVLPPLISCESFWMLFQSTVLRLNLLLGYCDHTVDSLNAGFAGHITSVFASHWLFPKNRLFEECSKCISSPFFTVGLFNETVHQTLQLNSWYYLESGKACV